MSKNRITTVATASVLSIMLVLFGCSPTDANTITIDQNFSDIHNQFWAKDEVTQLVDMGSHQWVPGQAVQTGA